MTMTFRTNCVVVLVAILVVGCGSSKESETFASSPDETSASSPAPADSGATSDWFSAHGVEPYPNLSNARETPWPNDEGKQIASLNATTSDSKEQMVAFYKTKYPDTKAEQSATAFGIGATTASGKKLIIMLVPAGANLTAVQYLLEE